MLYKLVFIRCFELPGGSLVKNLPAVQELQDTGVPPLGWEDPLEEGVAPTPVFWPESPMDRGAWRATVHGVTKGQTRLSD